MSLPSPNDPIVKAAEDQWHKLCALIIWKYGVHPVFTPEDFARFEDEYHGTASIFLDGRGETIKLSILRSA